MGQHAALGDGRRPRRADHGLFRCRSLYRGVSAGKCECFDGFTGDACQRRISTCGVGGKCSGHGQCLPMHHFARAKEALPLSEGMSSYGDDHTVREHTGVWDWNTMMGCACDSSWPVGFGPGEYQLGEYYGADCSKNVPDWLRAVWKSNFGAPAIDVILRSCVCSMAWVSRPSTRRCRRDHRRWRSNLTHWLISTRALRPGSGTPTRTTRGTTRRRRRSDHRDQRRTR